jgi:hypothetical protein
VKDLAAKVLLAMSWLARLASLEKETAVVDAHKHERRGGTSQALQRPHAPTDPGHERTCQAMR